MSYQNPLPPEGINVTRENHLAALFWLVIGFVAFIAASVAILYLAGGFLISHMPFRWEVALVEQFERLTTVWPPKPSSPLKLPSVSTMSMMAMSMPMPNWVATSSCIAD